jgi:hypothetical protein
MHHSCRLAGVTATALTLLGLTACTPGSSSGEDVSAAATASPTGVYGDPDNPVLPEPTFVATDAPVSVAATTSGSIFVTYSGWNAQSSAVEVGSYLANVNESDGTCTLTLTKGGISVTTSGPGTPNVTSTSCGGMTVPGTEVSSGSWTAVVTYESSTSTGTSEPVQVEVP